MIDRWRVIWRPLVVAAAVMAALDGHAGSVWYDTPLRVDAGFHVVDTLAAVDRATIHVRLAADGDCSQWGIIWNYTDDTNYTKATLYLPREGTHSDVYSTEATVEVVNCRDGAGEMVCSRKITGAIDDHKGMNSMKLVYAGGRATLYTGSTDQTEVGAVPFDPRGGVTAYFCDAPVKVRRVDVRGHAAEVPSFSSYATIDDLAAYIRASSDPMESFWEYLDRNTNPDKAVAGGRYTLATVRRGDAYDIIYIKGAEVASGAWKPMQLKGTLRPTIFRGNYDMEWISSDMQALGGDTDAQLSDDHAVLTLRFPELGAQMRLRRLSL